MLQQLPEPNPQGSEKQALKIFLSKFSVQKVFCLNIKPLWAHTECYAEVLNSLVTKKVPEGRVYLGDRASTPALGGRGGGGGGTPLSAAASSATAELRPPCHVTSAQRERCIPL